MNLKRFLPKQKIIKTYPNYKKIYDPLSILLSNGFLNVGYSTFHEGLYVMLIKGIKGRNAGLHDKAIGISKGL